MRTSLEMQPAVAVYNPDLLSKEDLIQGFVARHALLDRLLDDLRREGSADGPQHHLIVGQRGLGKTTLLRRLAYAVQDDPELSGVWLPLVFPEEQYNVSDLGDLWVNCVDALGNALEHSGRTEASRVLDDRAGQLPTERERRSAVALELLVTEATRLERRLLLLADNIDIVLDRLNDQQEWQFRRIISEEHRLLIVGASTRPPGAVYEYGRAFYDFFRIHELKGLNDEETLDVLRLLARRAGRQDVLRVLDEQRGRVRTMRHLSGGNPRTLVLLFRTLAGNPEGDVQRDVEQLLDLYTPLYKSRVEELAAQPLKVVDALAVHWDPITAGELAEQTLLPVNQVSAQLKRLEDEGVVEKAEWFGENKTAFQIAERFFNIWYLMRASRRVRRKLIWLVRFLGAWFGEEELEARSKELLIELPDKVGRDRYAAAAFAYSQAVRDRRLRMDLEDAALYAIETDRVRELIDLTDLPQQVRDRHERSRVLQGLQASVLASKAAWGNLDPAEFWRLLAGSPHYSLVEKQRIVERLDTLGSTELAELAAKLANDERKLVSLCRQPSVRTLYDLLACGRIADVYDWEGARDCLNDADLIPVVEMALQSRILPWLAPDVAASEVERCDSVLRAMTTEVSLAPLAWYLLGRLQQIRLHRYDKAEQSFRTAMQMAPDWSPPLARLGDLLADDPNRYEEAERVYRKANEVNPRDAYAWVSLGRLLEIKLARPREAEEAYRKAVEVDPHYAFAWTSLGDSLGDDPERFARSEQAYRKAVELDPKYAYAWVRLGLFLTEKLARHVEAEQSYQKALEVDTHYAFAWYSLGNLLGNVLKRHAEAERAYRKAIEVDPQCAYAWVFLGLLLTGKLARHDEAEQAFRKALEVDPHYAFAWYSLGSLLGNVLERHAEAELAHRKAIEVDPQDAYAWASLGLLLTGKLARHDEAEQAFRKAVEVDPRYAFGWSNLGYLLANVLNRHEEAERAYRKAIEVNPKYAYAWSTLGYLLEHHFRRYREAGESYLQYLRLDPSQTPQFLLRVCEELCKSPEDFSVAEELGRAAQELRPGDHHVSFVLAGILILRGNVYEGRRLLQRLAADESVASPLSLLPFRAFVQTRRIDECLALLEETGAHQRWRPLYEALRAAKAGTADYLRRIAPEVRSVAQGILTSIAPDLERAAEEIARKGRKHTRK